MSKLIDLSQPLELRKPDGLTVALVVGAEYLSQLQGERDYLREQLKAVAAERDAYRELFLRAEREYFARHEEEIEAEFREAMQNGVDFTEVLREIEAQLQQDRGTT